MKKPNLIHADELRDPDTAALINGRWVTCRPLATPRGPWLLRRFRLAWRVLIGRYDALEWEGQ